MINKIMKSTITYLLTVLLVLTLVQTQITPRVSNLFQLPLIAESVILINPSADCFEGTVVTKLNKENTFKSTYVACFVPVADCKYNKCHKGFIVNYTLAQNGLVQGFPTNAQAVFRLDANSAADYYIKKSSNLSPELNQIIDIACHQFDPTITTPSKPKISSALFSQAKIASAVPPSSKVYNLLQGQKFVYTTETQKTYIPQYSFRPSGNNIFALTAPTQRLVLSDLKGDAVSVVRSIKYDGANKIILERSDLVGLNFTNTLSQGTNGGPNLFSGQISLNFKKLKTKQQYKKSDLDAALAKITTVFSLAQLERLRTSDALKIKVYPTVDKLDSIRVAIPGNGEKIGNLDKLFDIRAQIRDLTPNIQIPVLNNPQLAGALGGKRLLTQVVIFNKKYPLYTKTVFGKTIKVSILVIAKLVNNQVLVITGTQSFDFFGIKKDIVVFDRSQNVNYNWSYSNTFSGKWSFNIYIPLPPPVSFLGINFGFDVSYSIPIDLSSTGSAASLDYYQCTFLANVGATLNVDAQAAIRAIAIEGGVFISGTLVSVRTDPKLVLKYFYKVKKLNIKLNWYFQFKPFSFKWGFFWRRYKLFSGWSSRKIIAQWTVSNPPLKQYPILNFSKDYKL